MRVPELMDRIATLWPTAFTADNLTAWTTEFNNVLRSFEGDTLEAAFNSYMAHGSRYWPKPAELRKHAEDQRPTVAVASAAHPLGQSGEAWAREVMRSPAGKLACQKGYALDVRIWALAHPGEHPSREVAAQLEQDRARGIREHPALVASLREPWRAIMGRVSDATARREAELRQEYG